MIRVRLTNIHRQQLTLALTALIAVAAFTGCGDDAEGDVQVASTIRVSITDVSNHDTVFTFNGQYNEMGPGDEVEFEVGALEGDRLFLASMFVPSNDVFIAPAAAGIPLYDVNGAPVSGEVHAELRLWDAGTEANQEPGVGADQPPAQASPNTGAVDDNTQVRSVDDDFDYPSVVDVISVVIEAQTDNTFHVRLRNTSIQGDLMTSTGENLAVTVSSGVWGVMRGDATPFADGDAAPDNGLEALAEDGDPNALFDWMTDVAGLPATLAPGVWVVHSTDGPAFTAGQADRGQGLEQLAEDGDPAALQTGLIGADGVGAIGLFAESQTYGDDPPPQNDTVTFDIAVNEGDRLSIYMMYSKANDLFLAFEDTGLRLFDDNGEPRLGNVSDSLRLWDAGTEVDQWTGAGPDQAGQQDGPGTGADDSDGTIRLADDQFPLPAASELLSITLTVVE